MRCEDTGGVKKLSAEESAGMEFTDAALEPFGKTLLDMKLPTLSRIIDLR